MSIENELNNLTTNISNAYDAVETKGGTIPTNKNMVNLPTAIESISAGGSFVGIPKGVNAQGVYGSVTEETVFSLPEEAKDVAQYTFYYAFYGSTGIKKFDVHPVEKISYGYVFARCCQEASNLEEIDFSNLEHIYSNAQYAFQNAFSTCRKLTEISFPKLTSIDAQYAFSSTFYSCTNITKAEFPLLQTVNGSSAFSFAFQYCTKLTTVSFDSLTSITGSGAFGNAFRSCSTLKELRFPSLSSMGTSNTNQFSSMLYGVSGCTVHFPASMQATIGSWSSVTSGFGGTNTTVLFDL